MRCNPISILSLALCVGGCSPARNWYDYGNGLVNLGNVHMVTSTASLSAEAEAKMKVDEYSTDEQIVRYQAHAEYCGDGFKAQRLQGAIPEIDKQTKALFAALEKAATDEFLKTCRVKVSGVANISFDQFTLRLNDYTVRLDHSGSTTPEQRKTFLAERLGILAEGRSPWHDNYADVLQHTRPEFTLW